MSQNEYQQICTDVDGMNVILEFPAERQLTQDGENAGTESGNRERIKKEIREILTDVLLEKMGI